MAQRALLAPRVAALCAAAALAAPSHSAGANQASSSNPADALLKAQSNLPGLIDACSGRRVSSDLISVKLSPDITPAQRAEIDAHISRRGGAATPLFLRRPADDRHFLAAGLDRILRIDLPAMTNTPALAAELAALPGIEYAELDELGPLNHVTPNDPQLFEQWHLGNTGQLAGGVPGTPGADIGWLAAWPDIQNLLPVRVAVIDTGVSQSHPDLIGALDPGACLLTNCTSTDDVLSASHGTYCAGILGARTNNGIGVSGIAPNSRIIPIKTTTGSFASQTTCAAGINEAVVRGARVISMSIGWSSENATLRGSVDAAAASGVLIFCSAGNTPGAVVNFPARTPNVIGVTATNNLDQIWAGSTTGGDVDLCAPGAYILSPADQGTVVDGYLAVSGTSMATPMVAGTAALIWGINPNLFSTDVRTIIETSTDDLGTPGFDSTFGHGRLNVHRAVLAAYATLSTCPVDYNNDGSVTADDIFFYLSEWFAQVGLFGGSADFDGDDDVDPDDLYTFLAEWFEGC